jgi:hypothetical protein
MDKKELKSVIAGLTPGSEVSMVFLGEYAGRSGSYTLESLKVGRGKGGSRIMVLRGADGTTLETGTAQSDFILNITGPDGDMHGHESATEVPRKFDTNKDAAKGLKDMMLPVVGFEGSRVRVTSSEAEFNGDFEVTAGEKLKGRYGQVRLTLRRDSGEAATLWSYRHSGIVSGFEVLNRAPRVRASSVVAEEEETVTTEE